MNADKRGSELKTKDTDREFKSNSFFAGLIRVYLRSSAADDLISRLILPLGMTLQLRGIKIHFAQIARAVSPGLIIEVP